MRIKLQRSCELEYNLNLIKRVNKVQLIGNMFTENAAGSSIGTVN